MLNGLRNLWHSQSGATAVEYGLYVAMIALAAIVGFEQLGDSVRALYNVPVSDLNDAMDSAFRSGAT